MKAARAPASGSWELARIMRRAGVPLVQDVECVQGFRRRAGTALQDRCKMLQDGVICSGRLGVRCAGAHFSRALWMARAHPRAPLGSGAAPGVRCTARDEAAMCESCVSDDARGVKAPV